MSYLHNQNVQKPADLKQPEDILPYLKDPSEKYKEIDPLEQQKSILASMGATPEQIQGWGQPKQQKSPEEGS